MPIHQIVTNFSITGWECRQERLDWTSQRIVGGGGNDIDDIDDDHGDVDDDVNDDDRQ